MDSANKNNLSKNMSVIKFFAIIAIIFGHYWNVHLVPIPLMSHWWVISAVGLLIFSISSGFFTSTRYKDSYEFKSFWIKKLYRIGIPFTIVNILLLILFLIEKKDNILSIQTVASWLGIHGIWTWLKIPQVGPYGAGLWFMTVLLIFYFIYPLLEYLNRKKTISFVFSGLTVLLLLIFDHYFPLGYTLWLTITGFPVGIWMANNEISYSRLFIVSVLILTLIMMIILKFFFHVKLFSSLFMLIISYTAVEICKFMVLPSIIYRIFLPLSTWVITMYIVHMYLFVSPTGYFSIDWLMTLSLIFCVSFVVDQLSKKIEEKFKDHMMAATNPV